MEKCARWLYGLKQRYHGAGGADAFFHIGNEGDAHVAVTGVAVFGVAGEEAAGQVRLRASRMQALARRKKPVAIMHAAGSVHRAGHSAVLGTGPQGMGWWQSLLSAVPVLALLAGLVVIQMDLDETGILEVAEVDAALLADDLPPAAYSDPGFVQFLKTTDSHQAH